MQPSATIIIPQFRHPELTIPCISQIRDFDEVQWPIIVVDDGSPDCEADEVRQQNFPNTQIVSQPRRGISAAWNRGAIFANTPYFVFLNNDVLTHGTWVQQLLEPLIAKTSSLTGVRVRREKLIPSEIRKTIINEEILEGWCFAVSRTDFEMANGFDESLAVYFSDSDFQTRVLLNKPEASRVVQALPDLPLTHLEHQTAHDAQCLPNRRSIWFCDRNKFVSKWSSICCATP